MRKLIVLEHISLDGVIQAPGSQRKIPAALRMTESTVTSKGVMVVNYERAGGIGTGSAYAPQNNTL
ncbi:MAG: hypothetical protein M3Y68_13520 [Chloroflexota bacterium]|nr:hypothetical protein [Chloroflexota bacterium]